MFEQLVVHVLSLVAMASSLRQLLSGHREWPLSILFQGMYGLLAITFFYGVSDGLTDGLALPAAESAVALIALVLMPLPQIAISHKHLKAPALFGAACVLLTIAAPVAGLAGTQTLSGLTKGAFLAASAVFACQLVLMAVRLVSRKLPMNVLTLSLAICAAGFLASALGPLFGRMSSPTGINRHALLISMALTVGYIMRLWHMQRRQVYSRLRELSSREEEYRLAAEQSGKLIMRFDIEARRLTHRPETSDFFGLPAVVEGVPDSLIQTGVIDPNSCIAYRRFYEKIFLGEPEGSGVFACRNGEGKTVWMHADFTHMPSESGGRGHCVISCYELKGMCEKQEAYRRRKEACEALDAHSALWAEADLTRGVILNGGGELMTVPPQLNDMEKFNAYMAKTYIYAEDREAFLRLTDVERLRSAYAREVRSETLECRRVHDGEPAWMLATVELLADPCSMNVRAFLTLEDIEERKRREAIERQRTATDELTGLLTRTAFVSRVEALCAKQERSARHAIVMLDIDNFRAINDAFGYQFGDRALREAAADLRTVLRKDDFAARFGGDEFMLCLCDIPDEDEFLDHRCHALCRLLSKQFDDETAMTASIGAAVFPTDGETFDLLYRHADREMSRAKQAGGGRFAHGGDIDSAPEGAKLVQPAVSAATDGAPHRNTLIVADSRDDIRAKIQRSFEEDYEVLVAATTDEARKLLESSSNRIAAVLLEARMEGGGGLKLLEEMSGDAYYQSIPVIMLNVAEDDEGTQKALELGAVDFIRLPVDKRLARLRVKNAIVRRETENLRTKNRELMVQRADEARHQSQLRYLAEHDRMTQLYNKPAFFTHAQRMLKSAQGKTCCMVAFDVQRFRVFNSIFGHEEGDRLLRYIAVQLGNEIGNEGIYSRTESDHFAFLTLYDKEALERRMERLNASMRRYNRSFEVVLSFGVYLTDEADTPASDMYDRAEMAKYTIKNSYIKRWAYYDNTMRDRMIEEQEIISRMNAALEDGEFEVYFQPKCRLDTGAMAAAEALVRWNHPTRGLMSPGLFIPIFEKNGFIMKLDLYMWEHVCAFLHDRMRTDSGDRLSISVNLSRASLYNPTLCETLNSLCKKYQVPNERVEIEITETAYLENSHLLRSMIDEFHRLGFIVEMDDFGSGYSSLNLLKELQVDVLKLDMQLVSTLDDGRSGSILRSIVDMAGRLSLPVIAEGVETEQQARFLAGIGCQQAQGYYYARPMPGDTFNRLLREQPSRLQLIPRNMEDALRQMDSLLRGAALCSLENRHIRLLTMNDYYLNMMHFGYTHSVPLDRDIEAWIGTEDQKSLSAAMIRARDENMPQECVYIQRDQTGRYRLVHADVCFLFDEGSRPVYMMTVEDVSRRED